MKKIKIKTDHEPLNRSDIEKNMNFDKFFSGYSAANPAAKWLTKSAKLYLSAAVGIIAGLTAVLFAIRTNSNKTNDQNDNSFVCPPVIGLNPIKDNFIIDTDKDTIITYRTGSIIHIPAGVFKTKEGKDVKGKVNVVYREFHDQIDQIFSGIPMDYDSAGIKSQFVSAGMFEILAFQDSMPVYLKDGKELTVNLASRTDEVDFNVYYLDTIQRNWLTEKDNTRQGRDDMVRLHKERENFAKKYKLPDTEKLIAPKKADPTLENFVIDYDKAEFPELGVYDKVKFEVAPDEKNYSASMASTTWEDVSIQKHSDNEHYIITFKIAKTKNSFKVRPVFDGKDFDAALKQYHEMKLFHNKRIAIQMDSLNRIQQAKENNLTKNENTRFEKVIRDGLVYRGIIVGKMGIYNCDRPIRILDNFYAGLGGKAGKGFSKAHFVTLHSGEDVAMKKVFLLRRDLNGIYTLTPKDYNSFPNNSTLEADVLIGITNEDKVMYISDDNLIQTKYTDGNVYFKMHEIDGLTIDKKDLENNDLNKIRIALRI